MANVSDYIAISVSLVATAAQLPAFNTQIILGKNAPLVSSAAAPNSYTSLSAVSTDYPSTTQEYKTAMAAFAQSPAPASVKIYQIPSFTTISTITFSAATVVGNVIAIQVNNTALTQDFVTDDATTLADLATQITGVAGVASAVAGANEITVTAAAYLGLAISNYGITGGASQPTITVADTANTTLQDALNTLLTVDKAFYLVNLTTDLYSAGNVLNLAEWIEANKRLSLVQSSEAGLLTNVTTDTASLIKNYTRTRLFYHAGSKSGEYPDVALFANRSTYQPGKTIFSYVPLVGITPDDQLTEGQLTILRGTIGSSSGKGVFIYTTIAGVAVTDQGVDPAWHWFDQTWGIDWLEATVQDDLLTLFISRSQAGSKVPYTSVGASQVKATILSSLAKGVNAGILADDGSQTVTVPAVSDQSAANQSMRYFAGITFASNLAGAAQGAGIQGTLTV